MTDPRFHRLARKAAAGPGSVRHQKPQPSPEIEPQPRPITNHLPRAEIDGQFGSRKHVHTNWQSNGGTFVVDDSYDIADKLKPRI